jgi:mono/diheme cytochrome c family protein
MRLPTRMLPPVLALAIAGCGSARRGEPFGDPILFTEESLRRGHESFMRHCNQCHPQGAGGLGPELNNKPLPGWAMHFQVRQGLGSMPSFTEEELPEEELRRIIAFLNRLQAMKGP